MTEFGQGIVIGGFIGMLCGIAAVALLILPLIIKGRREQAERKRVKRNISRVRHAAPIAMFACIVFSGCGSTSVTKVEVRERIDTLLVKGDTIRIVDVQSDTLYVEAAEHAEAAFKSVRAALDTTVQGVRLYLQYAYPPDRWTANIIQRDTVIKWTVRDSIVQRPYEIQRVPLWVYIAIGGMALALIAVIFKR